MRKLTFGATLASVALGTQWVLRQRPSARVAPPEGPMEGEIARAYAWQSSLPNFRLLYEWLAQRALVDAPATGRALDIGCGPGGLVAELARRAPTWEFVGLDASSEMLEAAAAKHGTLRGQVQWQTGAAEQLSFPDQSFDLVVSTLALHALRDPLWCFNAIARVLKPSGRFMLFDFRRDMVGGAWLTLWLAQHTPLVHEAIRDQDQPLASVRASYTPREVMELAHKSQLPPWRIATGTFWLSLESAVSP